ncbi:MAG: hypothetical protein WC378_03120 [Opitutaceae bacterium]
MDERYPKLGVPECFAKDRFEEDRGNCGKEEAWSRAFILFSPRRQARKEVGNKAPVQNLRIDPVVARRRKERGEEKSPGFS